jgi:hypothetical protein
LRSSNVCGPRKPGAPPRRRQRQRREEQAQREEDEELQQVVLAGRTCLPGARQRQKARRRSVVAAVLRPLRHHKPRNVSVLRMQMARSEPAVCSCLSVFFDHVFFFHPIPFIIRTLFAQGRT